MEIGEISPSMGVNTKPAKDYIIGGYWLKIDPNMPDWMFDKLKEAIWHYKVCIPDYRLEPKSKNVTTFKDLEFNESMK